MEEVKKILDEYIPISDINNIIKDFIGTDYISIQNYNKTIKELKHVKKNVISEIKELYDVENILKIKLELAEMNGNIENDYENLIRLHSFGELPMWHNSNNLILKKSYGSDFLKYPYYNSNIHNQTNIDCIRFSYISKKLKYNEGIDQNYFIMLFNKEERKILDSPIILAQCALYSNDMYHTAPLYTDLENTMTYIRMNNMVNEITEDYDDEEYAIEEYNDDLFNYHEE